MNQSGRNISIKQWAIDDRPREKLYEKGPIALSDAELIAILIGKGTRNESAVDLGKKILHNSGNNLHELGKLSVTELMSVRGIKHAKAITIAAALELGRRRVAAEPQSYQKIICSSDVYRIMKPILADITHEEFWVLMLSRNNKVIKKTLVSKGGVSEMTVDLKLIFKEAISVLASTIIACHNHPSENVTPSPEDIALTKKISSGAESLGIKLFDHIIIGGKTYYSFVDEGLL